MSARGNKVEAFFDKNNEAMIQRVLYNDICRRVGGDLDERQANRLIKTVKHYMGEVYRVKGDQTSMAVMNKEVLQVVLPDYMMYMERSAKSNGRSAVSDIEEGPPPSLNPPPMTPMTPMNMIEDRQKPRQQMDVANAFSQLQSQRQSQSKNPMPQPQDFRLSLADEGPVPMDVFEKIKQDREAEARRADEQQLSRVSMPSVSMPSASQGQQAFAAAGDAFGRDRRRMEAEAESAFADQERRSLEARASSATQLMPVPPDMRQIFLGDRENLDRAPFGLGLGAPNSAAGNPTISPSSSSQQIVISREPDTMSYKETELNLFVYSGDRNWAATGSSETRYNFSVSFDPGNMPTGLRISPTSTVKFRNIVRIELVKAIMPGESIDSVVSRTHSSGSFTYSSPYNFNILSFPYIQLQIPELDNNVYGTNQGVNAAFGILQYDANWVYDTNNANARGYFAMIPKFLKCQKVYQPTPLATINKLTFNFQRPDGTAISTIPDTLSISHIYSSKEVVGSDAFPYGYDSALENGTSAAYYFLNTSTYFNQFTVTIGDRIIIQNLAWTTVPTGVQIPQVQGLLTYLQGAAGLLVVAVGFTGSFSGGGSGTGFTIGANSQGYCNYIVVRGSFASPTTGSVITTLLGNVVDGATPASPGSTTLTPYLTSNACSAGALLNQSHQVQIALRVITRELDSTALLRPDNLY